MTKVIKQYDHPNYTVHREATLHKVLAATGSFAQHHFFQKARIRGVHAVVLTAGTATATPKDAALEVSLFGPNGTTSIANLAYGTHTAQHILHATVTATVLANNGVRFAKLLDATGITLPYIEYEVMPDSDRS